MAQGHELTDGEQPEDHLDGCVECRAAITTCLRERCARAEQAFDPIVRRAALGAVGSLGVSTRTPAGEDTLSEAIFKGWDLLLRSPQCSPQMIMAKKQNSLGGWLYVCMRNHAFSELKKQKRLSKEQYDPELPLDRLPDGDQPVDESVVGEDQARALESMILDYRREQERGPALRALLFKIWLAEGLLPPKKRRTQAEVAEAAGTALGREVGRTTVNRHFTRFREELLARIMAAPEIDDYTRNLAGQMFALRHPHRRPGAPGDDGGTQNG